MPLESANLSDARKKLIVLIEADEWNIVDSAIRTGIPILQRTMQYPTQAAIVDLIEGWLRSGHPLRMVQLGDPPGSGGVGYELRAPPEFPGLYVKVKIDEVGVEKYQALVLSFKE